MIAVMVQFLNDRVGVIPGRKSGVIVYDFFGL